MPGNWSRSLSIIAVFGLLAGCEELAPRVEDAPAVKKPVVAAPAVKAKKPAPVVIDFGDDGSGGGGWSG
ncbi:MAG: hypothetical protein JNK19_17155 [Tabrizicola sp.]|nr:hypothetical protein [Tabrizicola sp.]